MVTFEPGQLIVQPGPTGMLQRVWRLLDHAPDEETYGPRWRMELVDRGTSGERRYIVGYRTTASVQWINERCVDFVPPTIDPPQGDGLQTVRIVQIDNGLLHSEYKTDRVDSMIRWTVEQLTDRPDLRGLWFGWDQITDNDPPDMTVAFVDGELVWAD